MDWCLAHWVKEPVLGQQGQTATGGSLTRNRHMGTVLGHPPQPGGRVLLWDCWGEAAMLMDINGVQHCIHRALLGSGWQEGTASGPCVRSNTALLVCVNILHVLVGASGI